MMDHIGPSASVAKFYQLLVGHFSIDRLYVKWPEGNGKLIINWPNKYFLLGLLVDKPQWNGSDFGCCGLSLPQIPRHTQKLRSDWGEHSFGLDEFGSFSLVLAGTTWTTCEEPWIFEWGTCELLCKQILSDSGACFVHCQDSLEMS